MRPQKYKFRLSEKRWTELNNIIKEGTLNEKQKRRVEILLEADRLYYIRCESRPQETIATRCGVSKTTVYNVCKKYVEEGLDAAINRKKREKPPVASTVTSEKEAEIIELACSAPPEGKSRWTLRLLEKRAVDLGIVERISDTTIGRILKRQQVDLTKTPS